MKVELVCKLCVDPCINILLVLSKLSLSSSHIVKVEYKDQKLIPTSVLNSALYFMSKMSNSGIFSIIHSLNGVALPEPSKEDNLLNSIEIFKQRLAEAIPEISDSLTSSNQNELFKSNPAIYKPTHFDSFIPGDEFNLNSDFLVSNPGIWPYMVLIIGILGVFTNPNIDFKSQKLALNALFGFIR